MPDILGGNPYTGGTSPTLSRTHPYHHVSQMVLIGISGHEYADGACALKAEVLP